MAKKESVIVEGNVTRFPDRDPNDHRNFLQAGPLPSLDEDPELPVVLPEVTEVVEDNVTTYLGRDPNDVRLVV
jgi:hypothetical protein